MEKLFITGAGGFIGSHLVEKCVLENYEVKAFVHYNSMGSWNWLENSQIKNEIEIIQGDIRDFDSVIKGMRGCRSAFHLAALIGIPYSYTSPLAYIRTNVEGTYNILEAAKTLNISNVIVTSTSETYGTSQYVPIDEKHPLVGQSPYSASKIGADQLAISYFRSFNLPVKIVRPFNTYGPRQSARAVIPTIISQLLHDKPIKLGNLLPTRDLTFVKDTVEGFWEISKSDFLIGEVTNIGMNEEISIGDLAEKISAMLGKELLIESDSQRVRPQKSEVESLRCDNSKIVTNTNWKPKYNIDLGLQETIQWMKIHINKYKPDLYNV